MLYTDANRISRENSSRFGVKTEIPDQISFQRMIRFRPAIAL